MNKGVAQTQEEILAEVEKQGAEEPVKPVKRKSKPRGK
jgi:hypothetical protein